MKKRFILFTAIICWCNILNCTSFAYASNNYIETSIPTFDITLNGTKYNSLYSEYPFLLYNDVTYMPLTYEFSGYMGLNTTFEKGVNGVYHKNEMIFHIGNGDILKIQLGQYIKNEPNKLECNAVIPDYHTYILRDNSEYDNTLYPILNYKGVTYLPLTWDIVHTQLDWEYSFDIENGLVIDSTKAVRPKGVYKKLFNRMATSDEEYIFGEHYYLEYDINLYWSGVFVWETSNGRKQFSLSDELRGKVNYFNRMFVNGIMTNSTEPPQINNNILTIMCAFQDNGKANVMVTIDLESETVLQIETMPIT